jgi:hypothetical protein
LSDWCKFGGIPLAAWALAWVLGENPLCGSSPRGAYNINSKPSSGAVSWKFSKIHFMIMLTMFKATYMAKSKRYCSYLAERDSSQFLINMQTTFI